MDVFDDCAGALVDITSQDNLRQDPFHHQIEATDNQINALTFLVREELDPVGDQWAGTAPFHFDKISPVDFAKSGHFDDCQLLC
jgi:hypothetical protein